MAERASEQSIFLQAIGLSAAAERAAYLDDACRDNPDLRSALDALLAAHDRLRSLTNDAQPAAADAAEAETTASSERQAEAPGQIIAGRFKLLEEIGEGGMGTVWMAQQSEPIKRLVAIKLIKAGMDSKQVLARFDAERQALALMDHPNIAKVFDAGTTGFRISDFGFRIEENNAEPVDAQPGSSNPKSEIRNPKSGGRPYFVMELVKGVPITKYCDDHHLTPRQRLELFIPVCQAIQHAHQKGIIHRDIKPSNVLVAMYDDRPVPKVIDFGVAKATGEQLTEATLHTGFGAVVGTIEYMSPEQASFNQLDVDTRSDIYSLGVLLYELLAGSPPFTKKELEKAGMMEMLRVIREQEPSKPSTKLSSSDALPSLSANRGTEPARLTRLIRGELDWIVMKALEKDRNRRYESANGLAMDLQRYLADEPVEACPPSAWYRFRKSVRRNRGQVIAGLILFLALIAGVVGTSLGLVEARRQRDVAREERSKADHERDEARRQENIARKSLAALYGVAISHDPTEQFFPGQAGADQAESDTTSESLSSARRELAEVLADRPRERARLNMVLGNVLRSRGKWREAMGLLEDAAQTLPQLPDATAEEQANGLYYLGWGQRDGGDLRDAERSFRACLKLLSGQAESSPQMTADVNFQLGWTLSDLASIVSQEKRAPLKADAVAALQAAETLYNRPSVPAADVKTALCKLAVILITAREQQVNPLQLLPIVAKLPARNDLPQILFAAVSGEKARQKKDYPTAIKHWTVVEESARRIAGAGHPLRAMALGYLAAVHLESGDRVNAEKLIREALDIGRKTWPHHPRMVVGLEALARSLVDGGGDLTEALNLIDEAERIAKRHADDLSHLLPGLATTRRRIEDALKKTPGK